MTLPELKEQAKLEMSTLDSIPVDDGAYEMWKQQHISRYVLKHFELLYYQDRQGEPVQWYLEIERFLEDKIVRTKTPEARDES